MKKFKFLWPLSSLFKKKTGVFLIRVTSLCLDYFEDNFLILVTEDDNSIYSKWNHMASMPRILGSEYMKHNLYFLDFYFRLCWVYCLKVLNIRVFNKTDKMLDYLDQHFWLFCDEELLCWFQIIECFCYPLKLV